MYKDMVIGVVYFVIMLLIVGFMLAKVKSYKQRNFKNMGIVFMVFVLLSVVFLLLIDKLSENPRKLKNWILFILSIVLVISGVLMIMCHMAYGPGLPRPLLLVHVLCSAGVLIFGLEHVIKRWPAL